MFLVGGGILVHGISIPASRGGVLHRVEHSTVPGVGSVPAAWRPCCFNAAVGCKGLAP